MKMFFLLLLPFLAACQNSVTYDSSYSSAKNWLEVVSDKKDWEGKQTDSCYKLNLKFLPEDARARAALPQSCLTRCCWRGDTPEVTLDFNKGFKEELSENGTARLFTPDKIKIRVKYSSVLGLITASVTPSGAIAKDGTVRLKYKEEVNPAVLARLAGRTTAEQETAEAQNYIKYARRASLKAQEAEEIKQLTYAADKNRSIEYVKRFYGKKIDDYLYRLDLQERKNGYILINSEKSWNAVDYEGKFLVYCVSQSRRGKTKTTLKDYPLNCGIWIADLDKSAVKPFNTLAAQIAAK